MFLESIFNRFDRRTGALNQYSIVLTSATDVNVYVLMYKKKEEEEEEKKNLFHQYVIGYALTTDIHLNRFAVEQV